MNNQPNTNKYKIESIIKVVSMAAIIVALILFATFMIYKSIVIRSDIASVIYPQEVLKEINNERQKENLPELLPSPVLAEAAEMKAKDMAAKGYFSHDTPTGKTPWQFMDEAGYQFIFAGENLAVDFFDVRKASSAWMESPGHRANIMNIDFVETGIGVASGTYEGRDVLFIVQMFGKPAPHVNFAASDTNPQVLGASTDPLSANSANGLNALAGPTYITEFANMLANPGTTLQYAYVALTVSLIVITVLLSFAGLRSVVGFIKTAGYSIGSVLVIWSLFYVYNAISILA
jgi:hypothetical protein